MSIAAVELVGVLLALALALVLAGWPSEVERAALDALTEPRRTRRQWWETAGTARVPRR